MGATTDQNPLWSIVKKISGRSEPQQQFPEQELSAPSWNGQGHWETKNKTTTTHNFPVSYTIIFKPVIQPIHMTIFSWIFYCVCSPNFIFSTEGEIWPKYRNKARVCEKQPILGSKTDMLEVLHTPKIQTVCALRATETIQLLSEIVRFFSPLWSSLPSCYFNSCVKMC